MSRISKTLVHASLDKAARNIVSAKGDDNVISRSEMKTKLKELSGTEKALTDMFFRFIDNRDHVPGAKVTAQDVRKAVAYAREHMIDNYDLNKDGLSKAEIQKMSITGKLAVSLAKQLKAAGDVDGGVTLSPQKQAKELETLAKGMAYPSESDENYKAFSVPLDKRKALNGTNLAAAANLRSSVQLDERPVADLFADYKDTSSYSADEVKQAKALEEAVGKLKDVKLFVDGNEDNIRSRVYLVGRTNDGTVVGLQSWRVWT